MPLEGIDDVFELRAHEELRDHRATWLQHRGCEQQRAIDQLARSCLVAHGNPGQFRRKVSWAASTAAAGAFSVEEVQVFDVYEGKGLPEGKKSLALSLVFRSPSRTLTDDEVNGVLQKTVDEIARKTDYQLRK